LTYPMIHVTLNEILEEAL